MKKRILVLGAGFGGLELSTMLSEAFARALIARLRSQEVPVTHKGTGSCYIESGVGRIGRVDVDFFSNPDGPTGTNYAPSVALRADKENFGASRRARWFGLQPVGIGSWQRARRTFRSALPSDSSLKSSRRR